jgi:hypothetical protein
MRCNQLARRFQLALFWSTSLRSRELTPKRELRLGEPGEGCRAGAAELRRHTGGVSSVKAAQEDRAHFIRDRRTLEWGVSDPLRLGAGSGDAP